MNPRMKTHKIIKTNRINKIIYDLFGFTEKEIDIIKSTGKKGE